MSPMFRILTIIVFFCLSACSTLNKLQQVDEDKSETNVPDKSAKIEKADFNLDKDTLYDLLVAEIAAQRNQLDITLVNYIHQARMTRNPEIIRRAINAAQFSKDMDAIREMALLWAEVEPDNIAAHQLLAFQYSLQHEFADAIHHIDRIIELGGNARVDSLAVGSQKLSEQDKEQLHTLYEELHEKHPNNHEVGYSLALVKRNMKLFDDALALLNPILKQQESFEPGTILKANILIEQQKLDEAFDYVEEEYSNLPQSHTLGRLYASMLIDKKEFSEAEQVFAELMQKYPHAPGLKLSHALVMLENQKVNEAKAELQELVEAGLHINEGNFYLGRIADREENTDLAIELYSKVNDGIHFEPALERASYLLTQQDKTELAIENLDKLRTEKPDQARKLWLLQYKLLSTIEDEERAFETLNQAIEAFPEDEQLLYARAMTFEGEGDLAKMETDLRRIIEINPKNSIAINALGYTLADKTDRTQEALGLITLALSLNPDNPAILDSMGWVFYRLNKVEEALALLLKAYQAYPDGEVAAHLGEVLWVLDKKEEAKAYWLNSFQRTPEHKVLNSTIERFAPEWLEELRSQLPETEKPALAEDAAPDDTKIKTTEEDADSATTISE